MDIFSDEFAKKASVDSQLPGRTDGSADAYRHILWLADLTKKYGGVASFAITSLRELDNTEADKMDLQNNFIGLKIGIGSKSRAEIEQLAQQVIDDTISGKKNKFGKASWLKKWESNPKFEDNRKESVPNSQTNWITNPKNNGKINWKDFPEKIFKNKRIPMYLFQSLKDEKESKEVLELMKKTINRRGRKTAIRGLQRGLDTINGYLKDDPNPYKRPLLEDGILGQKTRRTLLSAIQNHGVKKVKSAYQKGQVSIALKDNRDESFLIQKRRVEDAFKNTDENQNEINNNFYIWKIVGDSRVRGSHENREGKKYSFFRPPERGHPGQDFGCRCYADPILI